MRPGDCFGACGGARDGLRSNGRVAPNVSLCASPRERGGEGCPAPVRPCCASQQTRLAKCAKEEKKGGDRGRENQCAAPDLGVHLTACTQIRGYIEREDQRAAPDLGLHYTGTVAFGRAIPAEARGSPFGGATPLGRPPQQPPGARGTTRGAPRRP